MYGVLTERLMEGRSGVRAMFLGGGGYTFPRWIVERYPAVPV